MKESIGFFSHIIDNQLSIENIYHGFKSSLAKEGHKLTRLLKEHFISGLATCGIGVILYGTILLFLQQLAEYGW